MRRYRGTSAILVIFLSWSIASSRIASQADPLAPGCAPGWTVVPTPRVGQAGDVLAGVDGMSSSEVWAVGTAITGVSTASTLALHWDGRRWRHVISPNGGPYWNAFSDIAVFSSRDAWAVGFSQDILNPLVYDTLTAHWDGENWVKVQSPNVPDMSGNQLVGVRAIATDDVWAVGEYWRPSDSKFHILTLHWDGSAWSIVPTYSPQAGSYLAGIDASGSDLWTVGWIGGQDQTLTEHWDGTRWVKVSSPSPGADGNVLIGVSIVDDADAWAVGSYHLLNTLAMRWDGSTWTTVPAPNIGTWSNLLESVKSMSEGDGWAVGTYINQDDFMRRPMIEHWDGDAWSVVAGPPAGRFGSELIDVAAASSDLWAVGLKIVDDSNNEVSLIERLCPAQVLDSGFSPGFGVVDQGASVAWSIPPSDTQAHTVTDASGMDLFDSGHRGPGTSFTFDFANAGRYPIVDTATSNRYSLAVPTRALPLSGNLSTTFTIRWSTTDPRPGYVADVQIKRPGETSFSDWLTDEQGRFATFTPDAGVGTYAFRARLRNSGNGKASGYSPSASITVEAG
jgi:hypothetical protein